MKTYHGKNHIDAISKTISRNIGVLTKLKHFVPEKILNSLYCTLILPCINYGVLRGYYTLLLSNFVLDITFKRIHESK